MKALLAISLAANVFVGLFVVDMHRRLTELQNWRQVHLDGDDLTTRVIWAMGDRIVAIYKRVDYLEKINNVVARQQNDTGQGTINKQSVDNWLKSLQ